MDVVDLLEEIFQWQTPFCTLPNDVDCIDNDEVIPIIDGMLVDIELPELNLIPEHAASHPKPLSSTLCYSNSISTTPVVNPANLQIKTSESIRNSLTVITKCSSMQIGTGGFEIPAPASPLSSAPNTPPFVKPKRSCGSGIGGPAKAKSSTPKTRKGPVLLRLGAAERSKENRVPTTAEHIIRERQRRDDMAAKYTILESLLPPATKRERAVVVEDAISFVGTLQQKKQELLKRRADLEIMASCHQSSWDKKTRSLAPLRERSASGTVVNPFRIQKHCAENCKSDSPLSASSDGAVQGDNVVATSDRAVGPSTCSRSTINVHIGEEYIVMEMVWSQPRSNFQSILLQTVESMGLDVKKCSILRVGKGYIHCVLTCTKSQVLSQITSEMQSSSTMIIRALRSVLIQS